MVFDPKARDVRIPFAGGACEMTRGLAETLFGSDLGVLETTPVTTSVNVKSHTRVRVIGSPGTSVGGYSYSFKKYPTTQNSLAAGGEPVMVTLNDGTSWTVRVSGPLNEFATFLKDKTSQTGIFFTSEKGTVYGPFTVNQA